MNKKILSFIMLFAVTFCFASGCKNDNDDQKVLVVDGKEVVATINGVHYTADQLYENVLNTSTNADYVYEKLEDLLINTVVPVTESMKNRINNEIEKWKKDIEENASINNTSYKKELEKALETEGVSSEEELFDKKVFALQEEIIANQYWKATQDQYYTDYLTNNYVYHVSQIFVSTATHDGNKGYFAAEVNDDAAKKLYDITSQLIDGVPFYQIAEVYSDDSNSKNNSGDLGLITLNDTAISDEVKYALAAYSKYFENAEIDTPEYMDEVYGNGVEAIAEKYVKVLGEKYKDTTTHLTPTTGGLYDGDYRVRAKNILFNNLFNSKTFRFLQADEAAANTKVIDNIKVSVEESAIYQPATENKNVVLNEAGIPILVVRSGSGIHFLSINKSAYAGEEELLKYYSKEIDDNDGYLTYVEKGITTSEREERLKKLESLANDYAIKKISGNTNFGGNEKFLKYDMFMYYLNGKHNGIKFEIKNETVKNIVLNYITAQEELTNKKIKNAFNLGYDKLANSEKNFANTINVTREIPLLKCMNNKGCTHTYDKGFTVTGGGN